MRIAVITLCVAAMTGCGEVNLPTDVPTTKVKAHQQLTAEEARIVELARQAVAANDTWVDRAEFQTPRKRASGGWDVLVWRLPKVPGGFRGIFIDESGKVVQYIRGK